MNAISIITIIIAIFSILYGFYREGKLRKQLDTINEILDQSISGSFSESNYDETTLSQIETKVWRIANANELEKAKLQKDSDRIKSLVGDISHQTKTPIANIMMYTELLGETGISEESFEYVNQIKLQSEKLNFLIQSLIMTSRLEMGIIEVKPVRNSIKELLENTVSEYSLKAKNYNMDIEILSSDDVNAVFDMKWTSEAVGNIIDNGIKYGDENSKIRIEYLPYETFVRINIKNDGVKIEKSEYSKIFQRFWRGRYNRDIEGVGIGLYLSREIVESQGGYIKVGSSESGETVFSVFLLK
ncbi:MAG: HAMP domain-containing histidine kinase [Tissierellia bacterium]|nr:HAMP domain-containing histidine kinase [Tissierellia bacterium]